MTRKNKIQMTVAFVVVGGLAWGFWPGEEPDPVSVIYAGVSTNRWKDALFIITNRSKASFLYGKWGQEDGEAVQMGDFGPPWGAQETLMGRSATNWEAGGFTTNRWRVQIGYSEDVPGSIVPQTRENLARFAFAHNWFRLSQWIAPAKRW